jgi:hypothetical protein
MSPHGPDARISHARQQPSAQLVIVIYGATRPAIVCTDGAGIRGEIAPQVAGPLITALRSPARLMRADCRVRRVRRWISSNCRRELAEVLVLNTTESDDVRLESSSPCRIIDRESGGRWILTWRIGPDAALTPAFSKRYPGSRG